MTPTPTTPTTPTNPAHPAPPADASSGQIAISFKMRAIHQDEKKTVSFSYSSSKAVQRTYAPQGLFGLLAKDLNRDDYFIEVDLDDPFFRTFEVRAEVPLDMSRIALRSVNVALDYGDPADPENHRHTDLVFDAATPGPQAWEVFVNKALDLEYTPRIEYNFDPQSDWQGQQHSYVVEPGPTSDRSLLLNPYDHMGFLEVSVLPTGLDPAVFSSADVELTYTAPDGWSSTEVVTVTPGSGPGTWRVRTAEPRGATYTYRLTHHLLAGGDIVGEPVTARAGTVVVGSPFPRHLTPEFRFEFPPGTYDKVQLDVSYEDPATGYRHTEALEVPGTETGVVAQRFGVMSRDEDPTWSFRAVLVGPGPAVANGPRVETTSRLVVLTATGEEAGT